MVPAMAASIRRLATAALLVAASHSVALACRCPPSISPAEAYRAAQVVVQGRIVSVARDSAGQLSVATVAVQRAWKGPVGVQIDVTTRTTCAYDFPEGQEVLLYLQHHVQHNRLETRMCAGNLKVTEAGKPLAWLQRHGKAVEPAN